MATDKLIPQYLNLDDDERFLKVNEMKYALNAKTSTEADGDGGVIKNIKGNTAISPKHGSTDVIPASGRNIVVGSVSSDAAKCIYYFLYNSNGTHGIYKYELSDNRYHKVYQNSELNFSEDAFVKADLVINQHDEHLLYFTDGRGEPMKINATKTLLGNSGLNGSTGDDIKTALFACARPPQTPATFVFQTNNNLTVNKLKDVLWQFAYQYVYEDGEVSAISQYSKLAVSASHTAATAEERAFTSTTDNEIVVTVTCGTPVVKKIKVLARKNNEGAMYKIAEVDNNPDATTVDVVFRNDKAYSVIPDQEALKPFDAVPRSPKAQTVSNNRLFYGNYMDGFDNVDVQSYMYPVYHPTQDALDVDLDSFQVFNAENNMSLANWLWYRASESNGGSLYYPGSPDTYYEENPVNFTTGLGNLPSGFTIDLSNISSEDVQGDMTVVVDVSMHADEIVISAANQFDLDNGPASGRFEVDVTVYDPEFTGDSYTGTVSLCSPEGDGEDDFDGVHADNGRAGNIRGLEVQSGGQLDRVLEISEEEIQDNGGGLQGLATSVANQLNGEVVQVGVKSGTSNKDYSFFVESDEDNNILNNTSLANLDSISMKFAGTLLFEVQAAAVVSDGQAKVNLRYNMVDVDLSATQGKAIASYSNEFHPDPISDFINIGTWFSTLFGGASDIGFTPSKVYGSSDIECVIKTGEVSQVSGSLEFRDGSNGSNNQVFHALREPAFYGSVSVAPTTVSKTFKAAADHSFGVVYFDRNNRSGGVQPLGNVGVQPFGNWRRNGNNGRTEVDIRLYNEPPSWAVKWAPVYTKNTSYDYFLQTTVGEACLPDADFYKEILSPAVTEADNEDANRVIGLSPGQNIRSQIYLSMRTLEGKANSYKEFKGGQLNYTYAEGDVLRVISYVSSPGGRTRVSHEFQITGYQYFGDDENNPIQLSESTTADDVPTGSSAKVANSYRRTGWFLSIRDKNIPLFNREAIEKGEDFWSQACIVEIYRPKAQTEQQLYYEVGRVYDIVETDQGYRTHAGDRGLDFAHANKGVTVLTALSFTSSHRFYAGDKIVNANSAILENNKAFINGVTILDDGTYQYSLHPSNKFALAIIGSSTTVKLEDTSTDNPTSSNSVYAGVVTLDSGDCYLRPRNMMTNKEESYTPTGSDVQLNYNPRKPDGYDYRKFTIEDYSVSDFYYSLACDIGRPHFETPDQKEVHRYQSVTYSTPFASDATRLTLSEFNPNEFPFKDYTAEGGAVMYLHDINDAVLVLQEKKASLTPVGRQLIESAGDGMLVTSQNVLGTESYFAGRFGISRNPKSFATRGGKLFFVDVENAKVIEISGKAMDFISDKKMESYFDKTYANAATLTGIPGVIGGIDPDNNEYITTIQNIDVEDIQIDSETVATIPDAHASALNDDGRIEVVFSTENQMTWDKDCLTYEESGLSFDPKWNEVGRGVLHLNQLLEKNAASIIPQFIDSGDELTIDVQGTFKNVDYRGTCQIHMKDKTVDLGTHIVKCGAGIQTLGTVANNEALESSTVGYLYDKEVWQSFYSFIPDLYAHIHNKMFTFKDGIIYEHDTNDTRCTFYGSNNDFKVDVISRQNPSMVKVYNAISLEGNLQDNPTVEFKTSSDTHSYSSISDHPWEQKEEMYYMAVPKGKTGASNIDYTDRHAVHLGKISAIDGQVITFDAPINKRPILDGSLLITLESSVWTVNIVTLSRTSKTQVTASGDISGLSVGDHILCGGPDTVNGDDLRDYYTKVQLTWDTSAGAAQDLQELYAVNLDYTPSPLHMDASSQQAK